MSQTTERVLRLLALLQTRPQWTGNELAERLGVTGRCIRRDVERLRELGYPVSAVQGAGGGYQLVAGKAIPPLLLDDDEAVAMAVALRFAAAGTLAGASESALRALSKLDKVMPPRLRAEVRAIQEATDVLGGPPQAEVDGEVLMVLARCCRDLTRARFSYQARDGAETERTVEPVRLVATGRRWYLMAWDLDRDDWRTFRLDRMSTVTASTFRFRFREHPDPVEYIRRSIRSSPTEFRVRVRLLATIDEVQQRIPWTGGTLTKSGSATVLEFTAGTLDWPAMHLARVGIPFEVLEPAEFRETLRALGDRLAAAAAS
ncbi:helix-turn-helix transcriptional regulator [Smaragdicoccus niigatensis]|uniref:helix-turn-helix transcriptional regulator n=1 Tax=Smaragdicoccus niigatensis TaxID=359359 RepID=UPI000369FC9C|nr:YafY family protein [Smaragdicoccus niigatensis]